MKSNIKKNLIGVLVAMHIISGSRFLQDSFAQTIRASDGLGESSFITKDDMKSYEIACKEHGKEYGNYYRAVRERIVKKLKSAYRDYYRDGDVEVYFVIDSKGSLKRIDVDIDRSTKDRRLVDLAIVSLQQASPFRPFPKELDAVELPFNVTVSFKKQ